MNPNARAPGIVSILLRLLRYGTWSAGWVTWPSGERWPHKERFGVYLDYYDGWHFSLHLGPGYIGLDENA